MYVIYFGIDVHIKFIEADKKLWSYNVTKGKI